MPTVYVESSIISYLRQRPSADILTAARQLLTTRWWTMGRSVPAKAQVDALHIAAVAHHRINYLLTWNCSHIANARILPGIYSVLRERNLPIPIICTPEELLGDDPSTEA
jgi:hypothetical protein